MLWICLPIMSFEGHDNCMPVVPGRRLLGRRASSKVTVKETTVAIDLLKDPLPTAKLSSNLARQPSLKPRAEACKFFGNEKHEEDTKTTSRTHSRSISSISSASSVDADILDAVRYMQQNSPTCKEPKSMTLVDALNMEPPNDLEKWDPTDEEPKVKKKRSAFLRGRRPTEVVLDREEEAGRKKGKLRWRSISRKSLREKSKKDEARGEQANIDKVPVMEVRDEKGQGDSPAAPTPVVLAVEPSREETTPPLHSDAEIAPVDTAKSKRIVFDVAAKDAADDVCDDDASAPESSKTSKRDSRRRTRTRSSSTSQHRKAKGSIASILSCKVKVDAPTTDKHDSVQETVTAAPPVERLVLDLPATRCSVGTDFSSSIFGEVDQLLRGLSEVLPREDTSEDDREAAFRKLCGSDLDLPLRQNVRPTVKSFGKRADLRRPQLRLEPVVQHKSEYSIEQVDCSFIDNSTDPSEGERDAPACPEGLTVELLNNFGLNNGQTLEGIDALQRSGSSRSICTAFGNAPSLAVEKDGDNSPPTAIRSRPATPSNFKRRTPRSAPHTLALPEASCSTPRRTPRRARKRSSCPNLPPSPAPRMPIPPLPTMSETSSTPSEAKSKRISSSTMQYELSISPLSDNSMRPSIGTPDASSSDGGPSPVLPKRASLCLSPQQYKALSKMPSRLSITAVSAEQGAKPATLDEIEQAILSIYLP